MKCSECQRIIPNKKHLTKNGCLWCDAKYHNDKLKEEELKIKRAKWGVYQ